MIEYEWALADIWWVCMSKWVLWSGEGTGGGRGVEGGGEGPGGGGAAAEAAATYVGCVSCQMVMGDMRRYR